MGAKSLILNTVLLAGLLATGIVVDTNAAPEAQDIMSENQAVFDYVYGGPSFVDIVVDSDQGGAHHILYFGTNTTDLSQASQTMLQEIATSLATLENAQVLLSHDGTFGIDQNISNIRLEQVAGALEANGVPSGWVRYHEDGMTYVLMDI